MGIDMLRSGDDANGRYLVNTVVRGAMAETRKQLLCTWSGPLAVVLFVLGWVPLAGYLPPVAPSASAAEVAEFYRSNTNMIRIGLFVCSIGMPLVAPFGAAIAVQLRRTEGKYPIYTYVQLILIGVATVVTVFTMMVWAVAAFRPDDVSPEITRTLNDAGWFLFLFTWAPFSLWYVVIGLAILGDRSPRPVYPRWAAYVSFWVAFLSIAAGLMLFFKAGPFAFDGLVTLYMPLVIFLGWIIIMSKLTLTAIRTQAAENAGAEPVI
jgi:hypothetical protein